MARKGRNAWKQHLRDQRIKKKNQPPGPSLAIPLDSSTPLVHPPALKP